MSRSPLRLLTFIPLLRLKENMVIPVSVGTDFPDSQTLGTDFTNVSQCFKHLFRAHHRRELPVEARECRIMHLVRAVVSLIGSGAVERRRCV